MLLESRSNELSYCLQWPIVSLLPPTSVPSIHSKRSEAFQRSLVEGCNKRFVPLMNNLFPRTESWRGLEKQRTYRRWRGQWASSSSFSREQKLERRAADVPEASPFLIDSVFLSPNRRRETFIFVKQKRRTLHNSSTALHWGRKKSLFKPKRGKERREKNYCVTSLPSAREPSTRRRRRRRPSGSYMDARTIVSLCWDHSLL